MKKNVERKVAHWLAVGEVGESSRTIALYLTWGAKTEWLSCPADPDDLNRCIKLLLEVPELAPELKRMRKLSPEWKALVDKWELIISAFVNEAGIDWCKQRSAPYTYDLMREIIDGARAKAA